MKLRLRVLEASTAPPSTYVMVATSQHQVHPMSIMQRPAILEYFEDGVWSRVQIVFPELLPQGQK